MKKTIIIVFLIFGNFIQAISQNISGIATYKSFVKTSIQLDSVEVSSEQREWLEKLIRDQTQKEYELVFNNKESLFQEKERLASPGSDYENVTIMRTGGIGKLYVNRAENSFVNQTEILGKEFLVMDSLVNHEWKLEKETKNIGEYSCFKATRTTHNLNKETGEMEEEIIVAWYTPQIPLPLGPKDYGGLPGLILELQHKNTTYLCSQIVLNPKNSLSILIPKTGTKVSQKQFEEIQAKKAKEMGEMYPTKSGVKVETKVQRIN